MHEISFNKPQINQGFPKCCFVLEIQPRIGITAGPNGILPSLIILKTVYTGETPLQIL